MDLDNIKWYVVTRNGRRIEERNYYTKGEAETRANALRATLKRWKDSDLTKVKIRKTKYPDKIT